MFLGAAPRWLRLLGGVPIGFGTAHFIQGPPAAFFCVCLFLTYSTALDYLFWAYRAQLSKDTQ